MENEIQRLFDALELFRAMDKRFPSQAISLFMAAALNPGLDFAALPARLRLAQSSVSRNITLLSTKQFSRQARYGLLFPELDLDDRRSKRLWLTEKGNVLVRQLQAAMRGERLTQAEQVGGLAKPGEDRGKPAADPAEQAGDDEGPWID